MELGAMTAAPKAKTAMTTVMNTTMTKITGSMTNLPPLRGLFVLPLRHPRLAPWAVFLRRFAAENQVLDLLYLNLLNLNLLR